MKRKTKVYLVMCFVIGAIGTPLVLAFERLIDVTRYEMNKHNCQGQFNTIPCHQKKINDLLREANQKELAKQ